MSDILIKGMEMPKGIELLVVFSDGTVHKCLPGMQEYVEKGTAVPAPPHGDLIDRDALKAAIYSRLCIKSEKYLSPEEATIVNEIFAAPTIIPAKANEERREYEAQVEAAQYCEMYEPSYDPETGAL